MDSIPYNHNPIIISNTEKNIKNPVSRISSKYALFI
jgi:hypothetical protein